MKRLRLLLLVAYLVGLVSIAYAQETIFPEDAAKFIGQPRRSAARSPVHIMPLAARGSLPF